MNSKEQTIIDNELDDAFQSLHEYHKEIQRRNDRLLRAIKSVKSKSFYRSLQAFLKDLYEQCMHVYEMEFQLCREPKGDLIQENWGKELKHHWVNQWTVGMESDSYAGYIYIKLRENKFLKIYYQM